MSLALDDLQQIRAIIKDELVPIEGRLEAIENDLKELYHMVKAV